MNINDLIKNKRIIITGGNGFLGSHVVNILKKRNEVFVPRRSDYDLSMLNDVKRMFTDFSNIDILIHIAADVGGIGYSSTHSSEQFYNNILMNTYIVDQSYKNKIKKFIGIGSVCEYPADTPLPFKESYVWNGYPVVTNDAYGFSKRMLLASSIFYKRDYNFNAIHLLPVNLYGPFDNFHPEHSHVIPALIRKIHNANINHDAIVEVWGTGNESREFLYVADAAEAIVLATARYNDIEPVNLGNGIEVKIRELCKFIAEIMEYHGHFIYLNNGLGGQKSRALDISVAKKEFNFEARTSFREGLKKTIEYFIETIVDKKEN